MQESKRVTVEKEHYSKDQLAALVPLPLPDANKYTRGKLTVVAGSKKYPGAASLAAVAGQRMGAGYVEVVCAPEAEASVRAYRPSLVVQSWEGWCISEKERSSQKPCAYVVGPGLYIEDTNTTHLVYHVLKATTAPVLLDGGALDALVTAEGKRLLLRRCVQGLVTAITPHEGEAARLVHALDLRVHSQEETALKLAFAYGVTAMVKGPHTFVSDGGRVIEITEGTSVLAKAGTGDVLAGMAGALLAQGLDVIDALVLASTLHAQAGRAAEARMTSVCVTPEDMLEYFPQALMSLTN